MWDNIAYCGGKLTIEFARLSNGSIPASEFLTALEERWQARLLVLFQRLGDFGRIDNREQFKKVKGDIWEFKSFKIRMLCYYRPDKRVVVTHGFVKKEDRIPTRELLRAESIKREYESILAQAVEGGGGEQ